MAWLSELGARSGSLVGLRRRGCSPVSLERDADSVQNRLLMENLAGLVSR